MADWTPLVLVWDSDSSHTVSELREGIQAVLGRVLDNTYRILEDGELGRGGFGAVFRAVRIGNEGAGQVAIKILNRNPNLRYEDYVRFQREAMLMSQLTHPGIATVYELGEEVGGYFIVMEFVKGPNLRQYIKDRGGQLSLPDIIDVLVQAAEALDYVHSHQIIHRDIKPQNMLISLSEENSGRVQVKLVDFGIARLNVNPRFRGQTPRDAVVGTYQYMPPEATGLVEWQVDTRADIYSLGIVAYEMLTGRTPFSDLRNEEILRAHVDREPPPIQSPKGHEIPRVIERIVSKCVAKEPVHRYQSMFALVCDLKRVQTSLVQRGVCEDFAVGEMDVGFGDILNAAFVGHGAIVDDVVNFISQHPDESVLWAALHGQIGVGKSRCLVEVRKTLEARSVDYLFVRFSESEQKLPFQALSLALNDYVGTYERQNAVRFRHEMTEFVSRFGEAAQELGRLIPALRHHLNPTAGGGIKPQMFDDADDRVEEDIDLNAVLDQRYFVPNERINEALLEFLETLFGQDDELVFLIDDLHLADISSLTFLLHMFEGGSGNVRYRFVATMRDRQTRTNLMFDNLLVQLNANPQVCGNWVVPGFGREEITEYMHLLGMLHPPETLVTALLSRSRGAAGQLHSLVKQMLTEKVLFPQQNEKANSLGFLYDLIIDWEKLRELSLDYVSIDALIANLENMDVRDVKLMQIAAVSYRACEFEYFRIEQDYSFQELETRLIHLVRIRAFEMIGEDHAPMQRRAFVFTHEKLRNAVLSRIDTQLTKQMNYALAKRIETIYPTLRREQRVALARHYDGAGTLADPYESSRSFLQAVRIYLTTVENSSSYAKYYLDKADEHIERIQNNLQKERRRREFYEVEYMIHSMQGNQVQASKACENLIRITRDDERRRSLQVFRAKLLLGLGNHAQAWEQVADVLRQLGFVKKNRWFSLASGLLSLTVGTFGFGFVTYFARMLLFRDRIPEEADLDGIVMLMLAQMHGGDVPPEQKSPGSLLPNTAMTVLVAAVARLLGVPVSAHNATIQAAFAAVLLRRGNLDKAFRLFESCESILEHSGMRNEARWAIVLRAIWMDYPMGRLDRLHHLFDVRNSSNIPESGIMHFEAYGLQAWLRLLSPSSPAARDVKTNESRRRRRSDRRRVDHQSSGYAALMEDNNARRILDAGENGQFSALALFADSLRYAMIGKVDSLRQTTEQLQRQTGDSHVAKGLAAFAYSVRSLVLGHQHEALKHYKQGLSSVLSIRADCLSLVITDALRFGAVMLPVIAVAFEAKNWLTGKTLRDVLLRVDGVLSVAEGRYVPRRSVIPPLFRAFVFNLGGEKSLALSELELSIKEARTQHCEVVECVSLALLAAFSARNRRPYSLEYLRTAHNIAVFHGLGLLERVTLGLARRVGIEMTSLVPEDVVAHPSRSGEQQVTLGMNQVLTQMMTIENLCSDAIAIIRQATRIVMTTVGARVGYGFLAQPGSLNRASKTFLRVVEEGTAERPIEERLIKRLLPNTADEPVRIVPWEEDNQYNHAKDVTCTEGSIEVAAAATCAVTSTNHEDTCTLAMDDATACVPDDSDATVAATILTASPVRKAVQSLGGVHGRYLLFVALRDQSDLLAWIVIPDVSMSRIASWKSFDHDMMLIGLHSGHLLARSLRNESGREQMTVSGGTTINNTMCGHENRSANTSSEVVSIPVSTVGHTPEHVRMQRVIEGHLPSFVRVDTMGRVLSYRQVAWRVFAIRPNLILVVQWMFRSRNIALSRRVGELVGRHLSFFVESMRRCSGSVLTSWMANRLAEDVGTILKICTVNERLDSVSFSYVFWDQQEQKAIEGDFGVDNFSFSGESVVVHEILREIPSVQRMDRLMYCERVRQVTKAAGWLFSPAERGRRYFSVFARNHFVESYLAERKHVGAHLEKKLDVPADDIPSLLAFFVGEP